jgi:hypothetical protein
VKAVATEVILTVGVLIAVGFALLQLRGVFFAQQELNKEEVVEAFAKDLDSIIDKAIATTGDAAFVYYPNIKQYRVEIKDNTVLILDKISGKTSTFSKLMPKIADNSFEDCEKIFVVKVKEKIAVYCKCLELGENCSDSLLCCSGYCNPSSQKCEELPICPSDRICSGATEASKDSLGRDCCPSDKPICSNQHCCPVDKSMWCNKPKNGDPRCMSIDEYNQECEQEICPPTISQCYGKWHWNNYGGKFSMNAIFYTCDMFEVCYDPVVKEIAEETINCCNNQCNGNCHSLCQLALSDSGLSSNDNSITRKKCYGLYIIYGLDDARRWLKGYNKMNLEQPASIMLTQGTWMCTGYSIVLTTLLRSVGYEKNEVYSVCGPEHAYNLVKFPDESKYRFVDTVGNTLYISGISVWDWYKHNYGFCRTNYNSNNPNAIFPTQCSGCMNDEGNFYCPQESDIILGDSC